MKEDSIGTLFSSLRTNLEELQSAANELEQEFQLSSNVNMKTIKTKVLQILAFLNLYKSEQG